MFLSSNAHLEIRMPWEHDIRQRGAAYGQGVVPDAGRRLESGAADKPCQVVLIDPVPGNPDGAHQHTAFVEGKAAGENLDTVVELRIRDGRIIATRPEISELS